MSQVHLIFDKHKREKSSGISPQTGVPEPAELPVELLRDSLDLPDLSEGDVMRHYTALSKKIFGVDDGFYPLGSCTMKYNPKINEKMASLPEFTQSHPYMDIDQVQGNLQLLCELQKLLCGITGFGGFSLQPAAGAHGELTGLMIMKAFFISKGEKRSKILCPDSSHGTNPASVTMCGFIPSSLSSGSEGRIDLKALEELMDEDTAGMMLTNPNTLGLFENDISEICRIVHAKGGLMYCDGANANAVLGISRFADMGYDICHLNLHKTFSTPHGGGGPGAGPVGVIDALVSFLPGPVAVEEEGHYCLKTPEKSIGRVKAFNGNFGVLVRAYTYIRTLGAEGLRSVGENAVLNANYLKSCLEKHFHLAFPGLCKHEFVLDDSQMPNGITTMDIAKRLLDFGYHSPTIYFPLIIQGAMMIEPAETESKETLDQFVEVMISILKEAENDPEMLKKAPHSTVVSRLDEVGAARNPVICYCRGE